MPDPIAGFPALLDTLIGEVRRRTIDHLPAESAFEARFAVHDDNGRRWLYLLDGNTVPVAAMRFHVGDWLLTLTPQGNGRQPAPWQAHLLDRAAMSEALAAAARHLADTWAKAVQS